MLRYLIFLFLPIFLFAHKINLFADFEDENLFISSYFANAKPCMNCKLEIRDKKNNLLLSDSLDSNGEYNFKTNQKELVVLVDAGAGHIVTKEIKEAVVAKNEIIEDKSESEELKKLKEKNRDLENKIKVLEEQLDYFEIFKVLFGLIIIALIFMFLKRVKN
jgi:nickel transport protein